MTKNQEIDALTRKVIEQEKVIDALLDYRDRRASWLDVLAALSNYRAIVRAFEARS